MNILLINKRAPFDGLGAEKVIWDIGKRLAKEGHEVTFFCPTPTSSEVPTVQGISFEFVEIPAGETRKQIEFFVRAPSRYRDLYRELQPDLVYDNPSPFPFHLAHWYGDAPVVSKVHTIYRTDAFLAKDHPLVKVGTIAGEETYRLFKDELFTPVSYSTQERLEELVNTNRNEIRTNLNGTETAAFKYSFDPSSKQVLYLSELGRKKGITVLLRAWSEVEQVVPEASLSVAGSGPLKHEAKELAAELGLENVTFEGYVSEDRKEELLAGSQIYTLPTYIEGMPLTPLEAMASGCSVVSTDTHGVRDIITNGKDGKLVPPGNPDKLAIVIIELLLQPNKAEALAQAGKERAEELTTEKMLERELKIVNEWFNNSQAGVPDNVI
jgi:glycosyltransferase involved in cell wall biosynthesis